MIILLQSLEPRFCTPNDHLFLEGEEVNEQIYVTEGLYSVGLTIDNKQYYHIKLKKKSIVGGYENMLGYNSMFAYKAVHQVQGYSLRKQKMRPIMEYYKEFRDHVLSYLIRFYYYIILKPMLEFKKTILLQQSSPDEHP